jgi:regulator of CtrA degradation
MQGATHEKMTARLVDSLYSEAMLLADETRAYFDDHGRAERESLDPLGRVSFTCESLKVTTRLMHVIAWLLTHRACESGEIGVEQTRVPLRRLGFAADSDDTQSRSLPLSARALISASRELYDRIRRLDDGIEAPTPVVSPARALMERLDRAF